MKGRAALAFAALAIVALLPSMSVANRNLMVTPVNPPNAPFTLYNCRGTDIYGAFEFVELGSYFTNESGKDITAIGVHFRLLRLDGSQIIGFTVAADKRVTAGTKNNLEKRLRGPIPGIDHAECAPRYAKFADGTEWRDDHFEDRPEDPKPSASPTASPAS